MRLHNQLARAALAVAALLLGPLAAGPGAPVAAAQPEQTYIVVFDHSASPVDRQRLAAAGDAIVGDLGAAVLVVRSADPAALARLPGVTGVARDRIVMRVPREEPGEFVRAADLGAVTGFRQGKATPAIADELDRLTYNQILDYGEMGVSRERMGSGMINAAAVGRARNQVRS